MNTTDRILERIKNNKLIAVAIVAAVCLIAVVTFLERMQSAYRTLMTGELELVSMELAPEGATAFADFENLSCRFDDSTIRAFEPKGERAPAERLGLVFTFTNKGTAPAVFRAATFDVEHVMDLAGGGAGAVDSNHTYEVALAHRAGEQRFAFVPNYNIPPSEVGAFTLAVSPAAPGIGQCWIARIIFDTSQGEVASEPFQMVLSRR